MADIWTEIQKIPPVTRTLCGSLLATTGSVVMNLVSPYVVLYNQHHVWNRLQIWRLYSSFFLGSMNLNFVFELGMLYRNANGIESGPYAAKSADFAWQLFWAGASIIALSIPIGNTVFFRPLLHCLNYLSCALSPPGAQSSIFGVITVPVKYMPYVMLAIELLTGGPAGVAQCIPGALIGHLWWWGVWGSQLGGQGGILQQWARAPTWLEGYLGDRPVVAGAGPGAGRGANQGGGVHVIPPRRPATSAPPGSSSSGYNWGSGQALGNS